MSSPTPTLSHRERGDLVELLQELGPDAPTLCTGWTTKVLAAHLVMRERHLAAAGIAFRPLRRWTESVLSRTASQPFERLLDELKAGPPTVSLFRLPGFDAATNTIEYAVHHEDVRRAHGSWVPRQLVTADQRTLWRQLVHRRRLFVRSPPVGVTVTADGHGSFAMGNENKAIHIQGAPLELIVYLHGRRDHAVVDVTGDESTLTEWHRHITSH